MAADNMGQELFLQQQDFIDRDSHSNYMPSHGLVLKNYKNTYIRFTHWATPEEIQGKKVLDLGCSVGAAGAYALYHGAAKYVGVDNDVTVTTIAKENLGKYYNSKNFDIILDSVEEFVNKLDEKFDIVFLGRVLHYVNTPYSFLKMLARNINFMITIEEAHPPTFLVEYLLSNSRLTTEEKNLILYKIEYEHPLIESHYYKDAFENFKNFPHNTIISKKNAAIGTGCSIGYLTLILNGENFKEQFDMYNSIKTIFPEEYGYGIYENRDGCKEYIVRFFREHYGN